MEKFNNFNSYEQLDMFSYNCISYLLQNNESIWKLLYYTTPDALEKPNVPENIKRSLIYNGQQDSSTFRLFMDGGNNDAFNEQCTILKIYPALIVPDNYVIGTTSIVFDCLSHFKINTLTTYSTRSLTMVKELIRELNGINIGGIGVLTLDKRFSPYNKVQFSLNDNKAYSGYSLVMSTKTV